MTEIFKVMALFLVVAYHYTGISKLCALLTKNKN